MSVDSQILKAFRDVGDGSVSGADLSTRLGISRAAVWSRINDLRSLGYEIEASPHLGYRLTKTPDILHADELSAGLGRTRSIGRDVRVFNETTSTNDVVEKLARDGVKEGVVVFAESQTRGRGRLGRKWVSPARKGLWMSILLRPKIKPLETTRITVASAIAVRRAIQQVTTLKAQVKWPNDILINGKKVAGILTELAAEPDCVKYLVLGIGVDVNLNASDFPADLRKTATSLKAELGRAVSRTTLAVEILRQLDEDYHRAISGQFGKVADEWEEYCSTIGQRITIRTGQREIEGRAESLAEDGALLLRTDHGHLERIVGGDVSITVPR
jgi:BirA family biotin operon repressor/biotin-[acetyl-CoA-carboxylase] ligase